MYLDIHTIEAFIKVSELNSFTLAAENLCITQSGVTIKIQRLEKNLGYPLFHRTPRHIYLSSEGEVFLPKAKALMKAHNSALTPISPHNIKRDISISISDHVVDMFILKILNKLRIEHREIRINIDINNSTKILNSIEKKTVDIAIITQDGDKKGGEYLRRDTYNWYGKKSYSIDENGLPLITMHGSCRLRKLAIDLLNENNIKWYDSFQGNGIDTIIAAAKSGLGVVPLPENVLTMLDKLELNNVGETLSLPNLPPADVVIYNNCLDQQSRHLLKQLTASIQNSKAQHCNYQLIKNDIGVNIPFKKTIFF